VRVGLWLRRRRRGSVGHDRACDQSHNSASVLGFALRGYSMTGQSIVTCACNRRSDTSHRELQYAERRLCVPISRNVLEEK